MKFARVIGTVVATRKDEKIEGRKFLLVQPVDIHFQPAEGPQVAIDAVGAGEGELVLLVSGSSARQTETTQNKPCDLVIMAIVDTVEKMGEIIFKKSEDRYPES
ncbi:MAG: EutN/CcmL family microcompartment protein [Candidatus Eremiobacteraeota bacterium]|nr:EutN/CcmL family microcompartment protein [Candidatus Eremiobacteraeota bacterium]